jgi:hypothetical protein
MESEPLGKKELRTSIKCKSTKEGLKAKYL